MFGSNSGGGSGPLNSSRSGGGGGGIGGSGISASNSTAVGGWTNEDAAGVTAVFAPRSSSSREESAGQSGNNNTMAGFGTMEDSTSVSASEAGGAGGESMRQLHSLCERAVENSEASWEAIRTWIREQPDEIVRAGAQSTGSFGTSPLHMACRTCPPEDIVRSLLSANSEAVRWTDTFGRLPLHYAAANGASEHVLDILIAAFPNSRTSTDQKGRTALHFSLGNGDHPPTPAVVQLLSETGACRCADENGMLPLHYACAYGATEQVLRVLISTNLDSVTAADRNGRTPLHFALANADRPASPAVVKILIGENGNVVNCGPDRNQSIPLHPLATLARRLKPHETRQRDNALQCLRLYINAEPRPTAEFMTALQTLPDWLSDRAVLMPVLQRLLNVKIIQRFPTLVIMLDLYCLIAIIFNFSIASINSMKGRSFTESLGDAAEEQRTGEAIIPFGNLLPMYVGAFYFLLREIFQVVSLQSLGLIHAWVYDPTNWVDCAFIFIVLFWAVVLNTGALPDDAFRTGTALSMFVMYLNILSFLKSMFIDFAVFVGGVLYVVRRLAAFLIALFVILLAFAQMFFTVFLHTDECTINTSDQGDDNGVAFCRSIWSSFIKVYTMMLGEVSDEEFRYRYMTALFAVFMFVVVILLAQVLIAIVTDSYGIIKNERAAIVFWSNRLDFVAEMDAISNGPWGLKVQQFLGLRPRPNRNFDRDGDDATTNSPRNNNNNNNNNNGDSNDNTHDDDPERLLDPTNDGMYEYWKRFMELFEDNHVEGEGIFSSEFWIYLFLRIVVFLFVIPAWILLGICSAGLLWPPQIRAGLLEQRVSKTKKIGGEGGSRNEDTKEYSDRRRLQIKLLRNELAMLVKKEKANRQLDRKEWMNLQESMDESRVEIQRELKKIRDIMTELFQNLSS